MRSIAQLLSVVFHPIFVPTYATLLLVWCNPFLFGYILDADSLTILLTVVLYSIVYPLITITLMRMLNFIDSYDPTYLILLFLDVCGTTQIGVQRSHSRYTLSRRYLLGYCHGAYCHQRQNKHALDGHGRFGINHVGITQIFDTRPNYTLFKRFDYCRANWLKPPLPTSPYP